jgi:Dyp-type peroxidase family
MALDRADIQGNILHGYKFSHAAHLFAEIEDARIGAWKKLLSDLRPLVTDSNQRFDWKGPETALNVALSYRGLAKLHAFPEAAVSAPFEAFFEGMQARAKALGDPPESRQVPWNAWLARHVWIAIHGSSRDALKDPIRVLQRMAPWLSFGEENLLFAQALEDEEGNRIEHFGFRDGIANPIVNDTNFRPQDLPGNGKRDAAGNWLPIAEGEFILGYPNDRDENLLLDLPPELKSVFQNGTFAVFRDLEQHVEAFESYIARQRKRNPGDDIASKMVGRKPNGEALVAPGEVVNFDYDGDAGGARCPIGSHVRRANPRSKDAGGRHRLLRRGMPYDTRTSKDGRRGMYFVAINASIENQFEFLQKTWINGPIGALSDAHDPIATSGPRPRRMLIEGDGTREPVLLLDIPQFVTCRGGQYYFVPGLRALELLGGGVAASFPAARGSNGPNAAFKGGWLS